MNATDNAIGQAGLASHLILNTMSLTCSEPLRESLREVVRMAVLGYAPADKVTIDSEWWKPAYRKAEIAGQWSMALKIEIEAAKLESVVYLVNASRLSGDSVLSALVSTVSVLANHAS